MKKNLIIGLIAIVIILTGGGVWYLQSAQQPPPASLKEVSFCSGPGLESTLIWVAKDQGYYAEHGLNVTFKEYPTGVIATQDIFNGKLDFLLTTEYIISEPLLNKKPLWVIGTIAESDIMSVIGRRDKGIERIPDLELKKIGVAKNTMAEYFLGRFFYLEWLVIAQCYRNQSPAGGTGECTCLGPVCISNTTADGGKCSCMASQSGTACILFHCLQ